MQSVRSALSHAWARFLCSRLVQWASRSNSCRAGKRIVSISDVLQRTTTCPRSIERDGGACPRPRFRRRSSRRCFRRSQEARLLQGVGFSFVRSHFRSLSALNCASVRGALARFVNLRTLSSDSFCQPLMRRLRRRLSAFLMCSLTADFFNPTCRERSSTLILRGTSK